MIRDITEYWYDAGLDSDMEVYDNGVVGGTSGNL
jgi:hypothetical protein